MPPLGDFLGHLMAEINIARSQADMEAVRLADHYKSHPMLQHFPVPRFRLPNVTLSVPVVVEEMEEAEPGTAARGSVPVPEARDRFEQVLRNRIDKSELSLSRQEWSNVGRALDEVAGRLPPAREVPVGPLEMADAFTEGALEALRVPGKREVGTRDAELTALRDEVRAVARAEIISLQPAPPRLRVAVTGAEIREAGNPDNLLRLTLSLSEEGMEWAIGEGETSGRLVPE